MYLFGRGDGFARETSFLSSNLLKKKTHSLLLFMNYRIFAFKLYL